MLVFDLESDGLLDDVTCVHCLVIYDTETDEVVVYNDQGDCEPISRGVQRLEDTEVVCGHNVIGEQLKKKIGLKKLVFYISLRIPFFKSVYFFLYLF